MKKIVSYNVNGIRAAISKGLVDWIKTEDPDIICIQETKAQEDQIDNALFEKLGYHCYWFSAKKKGYSGVGILTKETPDNVVYGMGMDVYDTEGRIIKANYNDISVISVYHPSGSSGEDRQDFKMEWLYFFRSYISTLRKHRPNLIISGDFNICRLWIDIHNPAKQQHLSGFLPEERDWFQTIIDDGLIDTFREFNQDGDNYTWWSYRLNAREQNKGWRIDYHLVTPPVKNMMKSAGIYSDVHHSDHCPIWLEVDF